MACAIPNRAERSAFDNKSVIEEAYQPCRSRSHQPAKAPNQPSHREHRALSPRYYS
jgi:hypothetical protein